MRTTIVPAQITTVEDKIVGNLNMTQVFLLLTPVFFSSIIYLIFPPQLRFTFYKLPIMLLIAFISCALAVRIKGKVIIQWIVILLRYNIRPRYFIANKNDDYNRNITYDLKIQSKQIQTVPEHKKAEKKHEQLISIPDIFKLEQYFKNPKSNMSFKFAKKGKLYVTFSEIK